MSSRREFLCHSIWASSTLLLGGAAGCAKVRTCGEQSRPARGPAATRSTSVVATKPRISRAFEPAYLALERSGELARREAALWRVYGECHCCARDCGANRLAGDKGKCSCASQLKVHSAGPHHGEERPLVGQGGSGTVFFSHCSLLCVYCQNWEINHRGDGRFRSHRQLAEAMLALQHRGCHNINLVTPSHFVPDIVKSLRIAISGGLRLPLVYNTGGYDSLEVIKLLDGIVDIYMPDFKYQDGELAARYSKGAKDYPQIAAKVITEMHRQVGALHTDARGVAQRGVILRHLVLPHNIAGTDRFVRWVAKTLGRDAYVNIMAQYRPAHLASSQPKRYPKIARRLTNAEWRQALAWARAAGLRRLD